MTKIARENCVTIIFRFRFLLWSMVLQSIRDRIAGSVVGVFWLAVYPLLFLSMYTVVFITILQVRVPELEPSTYVLSIFCGLVPFLAFAESFSTGTQSIVTNRSLSRNTLFPVELVPVKEVIAGHAYMTVGMVMVLIFAIYDRGLKPTQVLLPLAYGLQILMTIGIVWFTATINVFLRDTGKIAPIVVLFLMMVSPIAYTSNMVPENVAPYFMLNPLALFIDIYRALVIDGVIPVAKFGVTVLATALIYAAGFHFLTRLKLMVSDYA